MPSGLNTALRTGLFPFAGRIARSCDSMRDCRSTASVCGVGRSRAAFAASPRLLFGSTGRSSIARAAIASASRASAVAAARRACDRWVRANTVTAAIATSASAAAAMIASRRRCRRSASARCCSSFRSAA